MAQNIPRIVDIGNIKIPIIGLGTWKSKAGEVENAVKEAIDAGYRHIDCAFVYGNEAEVGAAICEKISEGVVKREDLVIIGKLWNTFHHPDHVREGVKTSLELLRLDYIDLYLMHWPMSWQHSAEKFPRNENGDLMYTDTHPTETYKEMEKLVEEGLVKAIGVSNFNIQQIQHVLDNAAIKPAMCQVEINPYFTNRKLAEFCQSKGIPVTAYSPLASPDRPWATKDDPTLLEEPKLLALATKYNKSPAQVVFRWVVQQNIIVIPKSVTPARIRENIDVFDFELSREDMSVVDSLNKGVRIVAPYITVDGKQVLRDRFAHNFPFTATVEL